jgi:glycerol uptake facilitator-like aquaporin
MEHSTKKLGMMFTLSGWVIGFLILALIFSKILDNQNNPNQSVATSQSGQFREN